MTAPDWAHSTAGGNWLSEKRTRAAVSRAVTALREIGIELAEPCGLVTIDPHTLYAEIGSLVINDDGTIDAVTAEDATVEQVNEVVRQAKAARLAGPAGIGWQYADGLGWVCSVFEPPN